jgi:hypothetical protein
VTYREAAAKLRRLGCKEVRRRAQRRAWRQEGDEEEPLRAGSTPGGKTTMASSPYARHDRLIVVDVEPPHAVVQGAEGAPPSRARCIWTGDSPALARGDMLVVILVNPSSDLTVVARVTPGAREGHVYELSEY